jgi:hypothetical protein
VIAMQEEIDRARRWREGFKFGAVMVLAIALIAFLSITSIRG